MTSSTNPATSSPPIKSASGTATEKRSRSPSARIFGAMIPRSVASSTAATRWPEYCKGEPDLVDLDFLEPLRLGEARASRGASCARSPASVGVPADLRESNRRDGRNSVRWRFFRDSTPRENSSGTSRFSNELSGSSSSTKEKPLEFAAPRKSARTKHRRISRFSSARSSLASANISSARDSKRRFSGFPAESIPRWSRLCRRRAGREECSRYRDAESVLLKPQPCGCGGARPNARDAIRSADRSNFFSRRRTVRLSEGRGGSRISRRKIFSPAFAD